jgi:hypothetical protein
MFPGTVGIFECLECGERFEACTVGSDVYGSFPCRTAISDEGFAITLEEATFREVSDAVDTPAYLASPKERRGTVFLLVLQTLLDQPVPGDWLLVDVHPRCPKCGKRNSNFADTVESSSCQIPVVRFEKWAGLDEQTRRAVVDDVLATLL